MTEKYFQSLSTNGINRQIQSFVNADFSTKILISEHKLLVVMQYTVQFCVCSTQEPFLNGKRNTKALLQYLIGHVMEYLSALSKGLGKFP